MKLGSALINICMIIFVCLINHIHGWNILWTILLIWMCINSKRLIEYSMENIE